MTDHTIRIPVRLTRYSPKAWEATVGGYNASGVTAAEAKTNLAKLADAALNLDEQPLVLAFGDYVSVSVLTPMGWSEQIYERQGAALTRRGSCGRGPVPSAQQEAHVRMNLAQRVTDWENDASVLASAAYCSPDHDDSVYCTWCRSCFLGYAAWQRAAAYAIAHPDECGDAHAWACQHEREFTLHS